MGSAPADSSFAQKIPVSLAIAGAQPRGVLCSSGFPGARSEKERALTHDELCHSCGISVHSRGLRIANVRRRRGPRRGSGHWSSIHELSGALGSALADVAKQIDADFAWAVRETVEIMVQLFAPMMPHLAEECWAALGNKTLIAEAPWPQVEAALLVEDTITLPVQINGRKRADLTIARDAPNTDIERAVLELEAVRRALEGKAPKKVIVVPQRIVNVVA